MSEQSDGIPTEDTPTDATAGVTDTPQGTGTDQAEVANWEERYKEAQAWGTRVAQEKAQLEQQAALVNDLQSEDPEARSRAFQALGLELAEDPQPDYEDDPTGALARRLEALEQAHQQQTQSAQQQAQIAQIEAHVEAQLGALDGLDDSDREWIVNTAVAMPPTAEGMPDIRAAHDKFVAWETARQQKWAQSKRAPRISQVGKAGEPALPLDSTHQQRVDMMVERLQADE